jgi:cytochrome c-type biogenesis protein CcmF
LAIVIAGITGSSAWKEEHIQTLKAGQTVAVAGYTLRFDGTNPAQGPNYAALRGDFAVLRGDRELAHLYPERRTYDQPPQQTTWAAIRSTPLGDLYAVIGDADGDGFVTRFYFQPLVPWMWFGAVLMGIGGALSLSDRRLRVGAPRRAARAIPLAAE